MIDILEKLEEAAARVPDRVMFHSRQGEITYGELWEKSGRFADQIERMLGDYRGPVIVYGHKDPLMLVSFFALARSGRAYCPVDRTMSVRRIEAICKLVESPLVLATEPIPVTPDGARILDKEEILKACEGRSVIAPEKRVRGKDLFYIIYTSGSSGTPKGVKIETGALDSYLDWAIDFGGEEQVPDGSVFINQSSFSFDFSIMDCYSGFINAATMWATDRELQRDVDALVQYLIDGKLNYWLSTPSLVEKCFGSELFRGENFPDLKLFQFCGEILAKKTVAETMRRFPGVRIINAYGPTEGTVAVTAAPVTREMMDAPESLPVGYAKPGVEMKILDFDAEGADRHPEQHFLGPGKVGEMIITGDSVCPGYYKNEEKTKECFFEYQENGRTVRAYHTGDTGYLDKEGMLYYVSRVDKQLKYHGFRIEPGDIESSIMKLDGLSRAVVVPKLDEGRVRYLAAFVTMDQPVAKSEEAAKSEEIREALREFLPGYMIPKKIIFVKKFPLNQNDKVDRKKLEQELD